MVPFLARDDLLMGDFDRADGWQTHHVIPPARRSNKPQFQ
jgi:hypothetical protein